MKLDCWVAWLDGNKAYVYNRVLQCKVSVKENSLSRAVRLAIVLNRIYAD